MLKLAALITVLLITTGISQIEITNQLRLPLVIAPPPTVEATATPIPPATATTVAPTPTVMPTVVPTQPPTGPCLCDRDRYNCSNFRTQGEAQACFNWCVSQGRGDIHRLDGNNDGVACENLPRGFQYVR